MRIINAIKNPYKIFNYLVQNIPFIKMNLSDEKYLKVVYRGIVGKKLNLDNPKSFSEKLQWLKLYDRRPEYTMMVDKYEVKKYVADKIGEEHVIPTYGVWDSFDEINFDELPDQFILKATHNSGGFVICKDKKTFDRAAAREKLTACLSENYYGGGARVAL